jgi:hypothetical protein
VLSNAVALRFTPPVTNVLRNPGFESYVFDANYNFRPADWTMNASFQYDPYDETGRRRSHSGIHTSTTNSNAVVQQQVAVTAGQRYSFVGWVNIPPTQDAFSFKIDVVWRNAANTTLSTQTIKTYTGATVEWDEAASNALVAPTGATNALIRMSTTSLNGIIYVDDFIFGR